MKKLLLPVLLRVILYPTAIYAFFSLAFFFLYAHPKRYLTGLKPSDVGLKYEDIQLKTRDGIELAAWFVPNHKTDRAIIVCHGYPMDKSNVLTMAAFLAKDFNVLWFDFRAMGASSGFFSSGGINETRDITAAADFLEGKGMKAIGVFGFSMGGTATLLAEHPLIKAKVADSPYNSLAEELNYIFYNLGVFRIPLVALMEFWCRVFTGADPQRSPLRTLGEKDTPIFLIHGESDSQVPVSQSMKLKEIYPKIELWLIKGADHGQAGGWAGNEYESRITDFFKKNLSDNF